MFGTATTCAAPLWTTCDMSPLARPKVVHIWSINRSRTDRIMDRYWSYSPLRHMYAVFHAKQPGVQQLLDTLQNMSIITAPAPRSLTEHA